MPSAHSSTIRSTAPWPGSAECWRSLSGRGSPGSAMAPCGPTADRQRTPPRRLARCGPPPSWPARYLLVLYGSEARGYSLSLALLFAALAVAIKEDIRAAHEPKRGPRQRCDDAVYRERMAQSIEIRIALRTAPGL